MPHGQKTEIFNDPVHGHMELHPLCVKIIDTPQFQRLRFIKQLGGCYFVFPGASHNRFEHSLGVCHLAGQLARVLQTRQPELDISEKDVLCVQIAGLCHDLGHGPFSHVFDRQFIPLITGEDKLKKDKMWKHEDGSLKLFEHLENSLKTEFEKFNLNEVDRIFIKELIIGPLQAAKGYTDYDYEGRNKNKRFLYDIVSNKRNGIDVDKWDYLARDCQMVGLKNNFDHDRLMKFSRVIRVDGDLQICFRDTEAFTLYEMFYTRNALYRRAYEHKVTKIIEHMITEAMVIANSHIKVPGTNGKMLKMSECVDDMVAFTNLTDDILQQILLSTDDGLKRSQTIIKSVLCRNLYKFVGESRPSSANFINKVEMEKRKCELMEYLASQDGLTEEDIHIRVVTLDYGRKDKNPMENVRFYNKTDPTTAFRVPRNQVSHMLPEKFAEQIVRVFCKDLAPDEDSPKHVKVLVHFIAWCSRNEMESPKQSECAENEHGSTESE